MQRLNYPENLVVHYIEGDELVTIVRISAYTNQSRVSHSVRMRENGAEVYPKQSSLERSFELVKELYWRNVLLKCLTLEYSCQ